MAILIPGICGPKASVCCLITSVWGVVMLIVMGICLRFNALAFIEDLTLPPPENYNPETLHEVYVQASTNCFIAAGIYVLFLLLSVWQRREYNKAEFRMN
ncbi:ribonuclease kappa-B-like [Ptychodera flava]|uniref:ribonuclease kappa-B-like n=1 Tax=Ptychodera flava TaxID=63121 RepID=UPI00396A6A1E